MGIFDSEFFDTSSPFFQGGDPGMKLLASLFDVDVDAPDISDQEQEILDKWKKYLFALADQQPKLYKQLQKTLGQDPFTLNAPQLQEIFGLQQKRLAGALRGEADYDPALERDISEFERVSGEATRRQLGPNFLRSSAGPAAFGRLKETGLIARDKARQSEIQGGTQRLLGLSSGLAGLQGQRFNQLRSLYNPEGLSAGFSGLLNPYTNYNLLPFQTELYTKSLQRQSASDFLGLLGMGGGAAAAS